MAVGAGGEVGVEQQLREGLDRVPGPRRRHSLPPADALHLVVHPLPHAPLPPPARRPRQEAAGPAALEPQRGAGGGGRGYVRLSNGRQVLAAKTWLQPFHSQPRPPPPPAPHLYSVSGPYLNHPAHSSNKQTPALRRRHRRAPARHSSSRPAGNLHSPNATSRRRRRRRQRSFSGGGWTGAGPAGDGRGGRGDGEGGWEGVRVGGRAGGDGGRGDRKGGNRGEGGYVAEQQVGEHQGEARHGRRAGGHVAAEVAQQRRRLHRLHHVPPLQRPHQLRHRRQALDPATHAAPRPPRPPPQASPCPPRALRGGAWPAPSRAGARLPPLSASTQERVCLHLTARAACFSRCSIGGSRNRRAGGDSGNMRWRRPCPCLPAGIIRFCRMVPMQSPDTGRCPGTDLHRPHRRPHPPTQGEVRGLSCAARGLLRACARGRAIVCGA